MEEGNWSNSTLAQMRDVSLPGRILSPVCLLVITLILLLLIFYKTYNSTLQRLFLYLTIVTVIQETCLTVGYATQFEYSGHKKFCDAMFIFWQWSNTVGYLLTLAIIVFLPYKIYEQFIPQTVKIKMSSCSFGVPLHLHCVNVPTPLHLAIHLGICPLWIL